MPTVDDVIRTKGEKVHSVPPTATVKEAIRKMNQHKIGALLVMQDGQVVGIFTERDVLRRVVELEQPLTSVTVGGVMTSDVICVRPETDLDEVSQIMKTKRIRHLPVCDEEGRLQGMVSIGDVNAYHASNQEAQIHFLHEYIYGRA